MRALSIVLLLVLCIAAGCGISQQPGYEGADRIPCTLSDDFETGELYAWESYPYAQDIGYDPTIICQKEPAHNGSCYALARIVKPNDALDLSQGFTKQIDLWTTGDTRVRFALFLMSDRKPEKVDVFLGLFDGRLFVHSITSPQVNRWVEVDIPLNGFLLDGKPLEKGEHVQVIALKAFYPLVSHLMSYTILIDDVSLNGERQRQFIAQNPPSTAFERFGISILKKHFFFGDTIGISASPEGKRKLERVECAVLNPQGKPIVTEVPLYDDGTHGDTKSGDGIWSNNDIYTILTTDPRGQWTINLTGRSADGPDVRWGFRFLMPGKRLTPEDHPRLHFSKQELDERFSSDESPTAKMILTNELRRYSENYLDTHIDNISEDENIPRESLTGGPYSRAGANSSRWRIPLYRLRSIIRTGAWRYAFTGDERAGMKAKEALLKMCSFKVWNSPWMESHGRHIYYPVGYMVKDVAAGYDFLYPLLSENERKIVRDAIMEKAIKHFYRDMVEMNRMPSSLSNHIAVIVSGVGLAATAIYGDNPDNPCLEPYLSGIMTKMKDFMDKTYFPGGSYGEPYTYQAMASRDLTETLHAFERNFGVDYTTTTDIKDLYIYPLYATHSNGRYQDFGDVSLRYGMTQTHFLWLSYRMRNPWTYAYVKPYYEAGRGGYLGYLWYTEGITPKYRDTLPTSKLFSCKGNMIMRSDWNDSGTIMIFKCGPNSNHYHIDQGTFVIMTNGDELLSDAGHSSSYYANLYYPCYYTQAIGHNVMLVDMNPESQAAADYENGVAALRDYPRIIHHFASDIADEVEGDLTCVYKGALSSYTRSLVFMKPDLIYLFDRVKSPEGHEYNWLFHAEHTNDESSIRYEDNRVTIMRPEAHLTMDVLAPEIDSHRIRNSDRDESFITLSSRQGLTETAFLAVLMPEADKDISEEMSSKYLEADGWIGTRVEHGSSIDIALFRLDGKTGKGAIEGFETVSDRFAVSMDRKGMVNRLYLQGTQLSKKGKNPFEFTSATSVSAVVLYSTEKVNLEADTPKSTSITLSIPRSPTRILSDGEPFDAWSFDNASRTITVTLPGGRTNLVIYVI